jgi:hypothetical protein
VYIPQIWGRGLKDSASWPSTDVTPWKKVLDSGLAKKAVLYTWDREEQSKTLAFHTQANPQNQEDYTFAQIYQPNKPLLLPRGPKSPWSERS